MWITSQGKNEVMDIAGKMVVRLQNTIQVKETVNIQDYPDICIGEFKTDEEAKEVMGLIVRALDQGWALFEIDWATQKIRRNA